MGLVIVTDGRRSSAIAANRNRIATKLGFSQAAYVIMAMIFVLLLLPILVLLGFAHRAYVRSLERRFHARIADQVQNLVIGREAACRKAEEFEALDRARTRVLVGMMNELRTPLMMIKSPLQRTIHVTGMEDLDDDDVERMIRQANRLQRGVDQIQKVLELELGSTTLEYSRRDFVGTMDRLVSSLKPWADRRGVKVAFQSDRVELPFAFDTARIEEAVHCLVERAFTDVGPGDTLKLLITTQSEASDGFGRVTLEITDDGNPINEGYLSVLRANGDWSSYDSSTVDATALGLALARRYVELHGGELHVDTPGEEGTRARMVLPMRSGDEFMSIDGDTRPAVHEAPSTRLAKNPLEESARPTRSDEPRSPDKETTVLVVDDHPETRRYLAYALSKYHNVVEATNGVEALEAVRNFAPDLVLSDVMMPVMDGNEMCRLIKSDDKLSHTPVFLVTANAVSDLRKEGLESGADDYFVKPFDLDEAILRINNEIRTRSELRRRYRREVVMRPSDITVTSADEAFLNRARETVEEHMDDGLFGVQELASELGLSPRQLQRRLRETIDQSPVVFIRTLRLQRAAQLLEAEFGNVSEVAYSVGFTSLSYFAKCFREQFGSSPSEYKSKQAA